MDILGLNSPALMDVLPEHLRAKIRNIATEVHYADGQIVHNRGDNKPGVTIVKSGQVRLGTFGANGTFVPAALMTPGFSMGEQTVYTGLPRILDCVAHGQATLYQIPAAKFKTLLENEPELTKTILKMTMIRLHGCLEFIDDLRRLPLPVRTAKLIQSLLKFGHDTPQTIDCSQSELASTLGVSRVALGQAIKKLVALKLIEVGYRQITVPNPAALALWVSRHAEITPITADDAA